MSNTFESKQAIIRIITLLYDRELSGGTGGNVALRNGDKLYLTPHGMSTELQYDICPDDIIVYDVKGRKIEGDRNPSVETNMHVKILTMFPSAGASIHAHPYYSTVFAYKQEEIPIVTEAARELVGEMPIVEVAPAGSKQLANTVVRKISKKMSDLDRHGIGVLLALHGILTVGKSIEQAFTALEAAEEAARCALFSKLV